jgi:hypothetical protein
MGHAPPTQKYTWTHCFYGPLSCLAFSMSQVVPFIGLISWASGLLLELCWLLGLPCLSQYESKAAINFFIFQALAMVYGVGTSPLVPPSLLEAMMDEFLKPKQATATKNHFSSDT